MHRSPNQMDAFGNRGTSTSETSRTRSPPRPYPQERQNIELKVHRREIERKSQHKRSETGKRLIEWVKKNMPGHGAVGAADAGEIVLNTVEQYRRELRELQEYCKHLESIKHQTRQPSSAPRSHLAFPQPTAWQHPTSFANPTDCNFPSTNINHMFQSPYSGYDLS
ncbi:hypothetical protein SISNIDRAFT_487933 [Sistotremastrum niveocremeum HHB9708]|uniref:Uncharacterized protein n=2 Tax=Sistotremastraceae TaxID=3402574 RepID=A0A164RV72_9AGAM|nr:hypothetical protein SISNIDRAFT_487933 [Sistotremastrum niveocremeum HHB9708]KZT38723.1 hypothetical protein SISSUDRAFT_1061759 [Sistotremastrum suecicum HHB10207 ss-3]